MIACIIEPAMQKVININGVEVIEEDVPDRDTPVFHLDWNQIMAQVRADQEAKRQSDLAAASKETSG